MANIRDMADNEYPAVIAAFTKARDRLWKATPRTPEFLDALNAYKAERKKRDDLLYLAYVGYGVHGLLTMGKAFEMLDEKWLVPLAARQAFHEFAVEKTGKILNFGPDLFNGKTSDRQQEHNELTFGKGTYSRYVKRADEAEMKVATDKHGMPPIKLDMSLQPMEPDAPRAAPKPQTPEEKAASAENGRARRVATHERLHGNNSSPPPTLRTSGSSRSPEERAALNECTEVTRQAVRQASQRGTRGDVLAAISRTRMAQCVKQKGLS